MFSVLVQSVRTVQQFPAWLLFYVASAAGVSAVVMGVYVLAGISFNPEESLSSFQRLAVFGMDLFGATAGALIQAVAFSMLGREIDKPIWRITGPAEGIRRFFTMWFIAALLIVCINRLSALSMSGFSDGGPALLLFMVFLFLAVVVVPLGACIMHYGKFEWHGLREALAPVSRFFPEFMLLFISAFVLLLFLLFALAKNHWLSPAVTAAIAYWDCVVFTGAWLMCIAHRETPPEDDDFDF